MKYLFLILILLACGKKSSAPAQGGGAQAQSACESGSLTGVYQDVGGIVLSIYQCGFNHGVNSNCVIAGNMATSGAASGTATVTVSSVSGACNQIPEVLSCTYSLANNVFGLTCNEIGINQSYTRAN